MIGRMLLGIYFVAEFSLFLYAWKYNKKPDFSVKNPITKKTDFLLYVIPQLRYFL